MKPLTKSISLVAAVVALMAISACDSNQMATGIASADQPEMMASLSAGQQHVPTQYPMWGVDNQIIGYLTVWNNRQNLFVTFGAANGWLFSGTNLRITSNQELESGQNPLDYDYTVSEMHRTYVSEYTYQIPFSEAGLSIGNRIIVLAKPNVVKYDPITDTYSPINDGNGSNSQLDRDLWLSAAYTIRKPFGSDDGSLVLPKEQIPSPL